MSKRHLTWLKGAAAAVTTVALAVSIAGCASTTTPAGDATSGDGGTSRPITIGWSAAAPFVLPALLANDGAEPFAERGLEFEGSLISAPDALPLLATGKLDVFAGPVSAGVFNAVGNGSSLAIVAPGGTSSVPSPWYISKAALGDKDPKDISNWKGQKVYTSTGAGSYVMISLAHILEPAGMSPTDLQFAQIAPDDVAPALTSGAIFAGIPASIKARQQLLADGDVVEGPSAVWPEGISPGFIFFGKSLIEDDPELAQEILVAFADLYKNDLQGDYQTGPMADQIARVLDYDPATLPDLVKEVYPADLSFPEGWTQNAENVWRDLPDVLSYQDSVADKIVKTDLIDQALKDVD
jgi:NitT/TauT family transport system substrate-binding protein